jgi:TRAP-type C4-dicarboxylate transport system permease small subunit
MLSEKKTKTNIGVGTGIVLQIVGRILSTNVDPAATVRMVLGLILVFAGAIFLIWGCTNYAAGKGRSKWLGLLGLLSFIGLIILVLLPDHHKESK